MNGSVTSIPVVNLVISFLPPLAVAFILHRWGLGARGTLYVVFRMLVQLLLVGYALMYIFESRSGALVLGLLAAMLAAASWISLRPIDGGRRSLYGKALLSIALGGGATLVLITQGVLRLEPWFWPRFVIPLGGMIFASAMNAVSLAAERFHAELNSGSSYMEARRRAMLASLIPVTNALLAVGLVSVPGMMTGQVLSGVSPLVAARYQIMVMCMIFGSAGISSACFLVLLRSRADRIAARAKGGQEAV